MVRKPKLILSVLALVIGFAIGLLVVIGLASSPKLVHKIIAVVYACLLIMCVHCGKWSLRYVTSDELAVVALFPYSIWMCIAFPFSASPLGCIIITLPVVILPVASALFFENLMMK